MPKNAIAGAMMAAPYAATGITQTGAAFGPGAAITATAATAGVAGASRIAKRRQGNPTHVLKTAAKKAEAAQKKGGYGAAHRRSSLSRAGSSRSLGSRSGGAMSRRGMAKTTAGGTGSRTGSGTGRKTSAAGSTGRTGAGRGNTGGGLGTKTRTGSGTSSGGSKTTGARSGGLGAGSSRRGGASTSSGRTGSRSGSRALGTGSRASAARSARGGSRSPLSRGSQSRRAGRTTTGARSTGTNSSSRRNGRKLARAVLATPGRKLVRDPLRRHLKKKDAIKGKGERDADKGAKRQQKTFSRAQRTAARNAMKRRRAMTRHIAREIGTNRAKRGRKIAGYSWMPLKKARETPPGPKKVAATSAAVMFGLAGTAVAAIPGSVWLFKGPQWVGCIVGREVTGAIDGARALTNPYRVASGPVYREVVDTEGNYDVDIDYEALDTNLTPLVEQVKASSGIDDYMRDGILPGSLVPAWLFDAEKVLLQFAELLEQDGELFKRKVDQEDGGALIAESSTMLSDTASSMRQLAENWMQLHAEKLGHQQDTSESAGSFNAGIVHQ